MDYIIQEVIKTMKMLDGASKKMPKPLLKKEAVQEGLRLSATVCRQAESVVATPLMKNLMVCMGDVKQAKGEDGEWHTEKLKPGTKTKAVDWMNRVVNAALLKYNGTEQHEYPTNLPIGDPRLYDIDCWNGWKDTIWDIVPGQAEETKEGFLKFANPKTNISVDDVIRLIQHDPVLQKVITIELKLWPLVRASREVKAISDPFMAKKTGVSYPDYHNDAQTLPDSDITWGRYEIELVEKAYAKGLQSLLNFAYENNVYTGYTRRQRGKGRPLIAQSRRSNLVVNMVNGVEMQQWKQNPALNMALVPEDQILAHFAEMGDFLEKHPEYYAFNIDGKSWDQNIGIGWICLQDALRYINAQGSFTKELVKLRYCLNSKGYLIDGLNKRMYEIYGRMFSGYLDTTLGNTGANRLISKYYAMKSDPDYMNNIEIPMNHKSVHCIGDDTLVAGRKDCLPRMIEIGNKDAKIVIHEDEKHAWGLMFIQWRAIKPDKRWIMAYNWPRVLRSMLSKEDPKMLGEAGWTLSFYQQLGKLRMKPDALRIVLNIAAALDKNHLMLDVPVTQIIRKVQEEDEKRLDEGVKNRKAKLKKMRTTVERLYNDNPTISGVKETADGSVELDRNYFVKLQKELKAVYDPSFLTTLGFKAPDLSLVH